MASPSSNPPGMLQFPLGPGFVFEPTDEELVFHYLIGKVSGRTDGIGFRYFNDNMDDILKHQPFKLSNLAPGCSKKMYFFTEVHKYHHQNIERKVPGGGAWKQSMEFCFNGIDGKPVAKKTSLTYYYKADKSLQLVEIHWRLEEYTILDAQEFKAITPRVLCVLYLRDDK